MVLTRRHLSRNAPKTQTEAPLPHTHTCKPTTTSTDNPSSPDLTSPDLTSPDLSSPFLTTPQPTLASLPTELHLLIASHLPYPDALSLKHASRHFYHTVPTGINLKVAWLISRHTLHLDCPSDTRCDLRTDTNFCRGSVGRLIRRRRLHLECNSRPGLGCIVHDTPRCVHHDTRARRFWPLAMECLRRPAVALAVSRLLLPLLVLALAVVVVQFGGWPHFA